MDASGAASSSYQSHHAGMSIFPSAAPADLNNPTLQQQRQQQESTPFLRSFEAEIPANQLQSFGQTHAAPFGYASGANPHIRAPAIPINEYGPQPVYHLKVTATPVNVLPEKAANPNYVVTTFPAPPGQANHANTAGGSVIAHAAGANNNERGLLIRPQHFQPYNPNIGQQQAPSYLSPNETAPRGSLDSSSGSLQQAINSEAEENVMFTAGPYTGHSGKATFHMYEGEKILPTSELVYRTMNQEIADALPDVVQYIGGPDNMTPGQKYHRYHHNDYPDNEVLLTGRSRRLDSALLAATLDTEEAPKEYSWIVPASVAKDTMDHGLSIADDNAALSMGPYSPEDHSVSTFMGTQREYDAESESTRRRNSGSNTGNEEENVPAWKNFLHKLLPKRQRNRQERRHSSFTASERERRQPTMSNMNNLFANASGELQGQLAQLEQENNNRRNSTRSAALNNTEMGLGISPMDNNGYPSEKESSQDVLVNDPTDDVLGLPDTIKPSVHYGGLEFAPPRFAGNLDPVKFKLHAIEIHQYLPLPQADSPWFLREKRDPTTTAIFGPMPLPFDPAHTGMVAPTFQSIAPQFGAPCPALAPELERMFNHELPITYHGEHKNSENGVSSGNPVAESENAIYVT